MIGASSNAGEGSTAGHFGLNGNRSLDVCSALDVCSLLSVDLGETMCLCRCVFDQRQSLRMCDECHYGRSECDECGCQGCVYLEYPRGLFSNGLQKSKLLELIIPDSVREVCDRCFFQCNNLRRVIFGCSSSCARIGFAAFKGAHIDEIIIPDSVREICEQSFARCWLERIIFGCHSLLNIIGDMAFSFTPLEEFCVPDNVLEIGGECFEDCSELAHIHFGPSSSLRLIGPSAFVGASVSEIVLPASVEELGDRCFKGQVLDEGISRVTCSSGALLRRIGRQAFRRSEIRYICIPDSVVELGPKCFQETFIAHFTFGECPSLEIIGEKCFQRSDIRNGFRMPSSVKHVGRNAFAGCSFGDNFDFYFFDAVDSRFVQVYCSREKLSVVPLD